MVHQQDEGRIRQLLRLWFGFEAPVSRRAYLFSGLSLTLVKFVGDNFVVFQSRELFWGPFRYLSPYGWSRLSQLSAGDLAVIALWSLPFLWVGASMTVRRTAGAGLHPGLALSFFVPGLNYFLIALLCILQRGREPGRVPAERRAAETAGRRQLDIDFLLATGVATLVGLATLAIAVVGKPNYALPLFVGTPFVQGFTAAWLYERRTRRSNWESGLVVQTAAVVTGGAMLAFGIEGLLCLAMALPLASFIAWLGGILGRGVAVDRLLRTDRFWLVLAIAPLMAAIVPPPAAPLREVMTSVEIEASPETVWANVTAFTELPPPARFYFKLGIAHPIRAHYVGEGTDAVRYCEFSTGPFVEPITVWDEPNRLAFDVVAQPPTLEEWSPYRSVEPPHVRGSLRSEKGEFRLIRLPGGRTRLEGRTWYRLELFPQSYWTLWSDGLIHGIHRRVLEHVKDLSERDSHDV